MSKDCIHSRSSSTTTTSIEQQKKKKKKKIERNAKKRVVRIYARIQKLFLEEDFFLWDRLFKPVKKLEIAAAVFPYVGSHLCRQDAALLQRAKVLVPSTRHARCQIWDNSWPTEA